MATSGLDDPFVREHIDPETYQKVCEEVDMLESMGGPFDPAAVLAGQVTPVYFGSAINNFARTTIAGWLPAVLLRAHRTSQW